MFKAGDVVRLNKAGLEYWQFYHPGVRDWFDKEFRICVHPIKGDHTRRSDKLCIIPMPRIDFTDLKYPWMSFRDEHMELVNKFEIEQI